MKTQQFQKKVGLIEYAKIVTLLTKGNSTIEISCELNFSHKAVIGAKKVYQRFLGTRK